MRDTDAAILNAFDTLPDMEALRSAFASRTRRIARYSPAR